MANLVAHRLIEAHCDARMTTCHTPVLPSAWNGHCACEAHHPNEESIMPSTTIPSCDAETSAERSARSTSWGA